MFSRLEFLWGAPAIKFVDSIGRYFKNAPHLPDSIVSFMVSIAPWVAGLFGVLNTLGGLSALGSVRGGTVLEGLSAQVGVTLDPNYLTIVGVLQVIIGALMLLAFTPLRQHSRRGWALLFWVTVIGLAQSVVGVVFGLGGIFGLVISTLIGFYILFEIRSTYR